MQVLIVDNDKSAADALKTHLEELGHAVAIEAAGNNLLKKISGDFYDVIFMDPTPMGSTKPVVLDIRRQSQNYPYVVVTSEALQADDVLKIGANDSFSKPYDFNALSIKLKNAERLLSLIARMGDDSEDFPSAGGVIAKSAFNQLFLSGIDRADRYGEGTYILFFTVQNYDEILRLDGSYAADYGVAKLSQYLVRLRRQSDIIGQTAKYEYALLLQRPMYETEPVEAANRFADALRDFNQVISSGGAPLELILSLVKIPPGELVVEHIVDG